MNIEARKLSILQYLAEINDESIIMQIENLLKPKNDFWDDLSEEHKQVIKKGIQDLNEGKSIDFDQYISKHK